MENRVKNKKIVHIIPAIKIGGVEKLVLSSVVELNKKVDYRVIVVGEVDEKLWNELPDTIKSFIDLPMSKNWILGVIEAVRKLRKAKPDIVISSLWKSVLAVFLMRQMPFLHLGFIHSSKSAHFADKFFLRWQIKNAKFLFADSNAALSFIHTIKPKAKAVVVPLIFNTCRSDGKTLNGSILKFCFVGRLNPVKGIEHTLRFIHLLYSAGIIFRFDFYGNDEGELERITNFMTENPSIKVNCKGLVMPWLVNEVFNDYHFIVQLSKYEGMGMSIVEAIQNGVVPIVTAVGEIPNYAKHLENAIVLKPGEEDDLVKALEVIKTIAKVPAIYNTLSANAVKTFASHESYIEKMGEMLQSFR